MKILSIGNSFSVDCQRYVRDLAAAGGMELTLGNLYIGGCSLEGHCENMQSGLPAYEYFYNNKSMGACALKTGILDENWDIVTLQQASHFSGMSETYYPFINELNDYVKKLLPNAQIYVNQTWAYEYNSTHHCFVNYGSDRIKMHALLSEAYEKAANSIGAKLIPVGKAVALARENEAFDPQKGGIALTRDGFHLSYSYGRYLAAAVWYACLLNGNLKANTFYPADYEYTGRDKYTNKPIYIEIPGTRADEALIDKLKDIALQAVV